MKKINIFFCMFCMILLVGCAEDSLQYVGEDVKTVEVSAESAFIDSEIVKNTIQVHICGEVYFPGVYTVYSGSRIYEVVQQAGGFTKEADTEGINQAREVSDGEQIYIPSLGERDNGTDEKGLIDVNKADEETLCTIPGIGETRAKQIIEYRNNNGNFKKVEDIMNVTGIKEGIFEKIAPYITVS